MSNCHGIRQYAFEPGASSSWQSLGTFTLALEAEGSLGYSGDADYGLDTITLGSGVSDGAIISDQLIAGLATDLLYLGGLGMHPTPLNLSNSKSTYPSVIGHLHDQNAIPSLTYAYTAGAVYKTPPTFGSLIFGGYDSTRLIPNNVWFTFTPIPYRDIFLGLTAITSDSDSLLPVPLFIYVDSTVTQFWLPVETCLRFENVFGLIWNETTNFYFVNDSLHETLLARNASITLSLANGLIRDIHDDTITVNITLPYASFDLVASYPFAGIGMNETIRYFPLRRAQDATQYTLGRVFLQESYLIVDYERKNFSLSQALFPTSGTSSNIVAIPGISSNGTLT